jgi:hypothetical protein
MLADVWVRAATRPPLRDGSALVSAYKGNVSLGGCERPQVVPTKRLRGYRVYARLVSPLGSGVLSRPYAPMPIWQNALLADAELGEDAVEQVGGGGLTGDLAEGFERGAQIDGDEVQRQAVLQGGRCGFE